MPKDREIGIPASVYDVDVDVDIDLGLSGDAVAQAHRHGQGRKVGLTLSHRSQFHPDIN